MAAAAILDISQFQSYISFYIILDSFYTQNYLSNEVLHDHISQNMDLLVFGERNFSRGYKNGLGG